MDPLQPVEILCRFSLQQLDLIATALDQMSWRDQERKKLINNTLISVQMQRSFGERKK